MRQCDVTPKLCENLPEVRVGHILRGPGVGHGVFVVTARADQMVARGAKWESFVL